jgi:hypothetical protein
MGNLPFRGARVMEYYQKEDVSGIIQGLWETGGFGLCVLLVQEGI